MSYGVSVLVVILVLYIGKVFGIIMQLDNLGISKKNILVIWLTPLMELFFIISLFCDKDTSFLEAFRIMIALLRDPELSIIIPILYQKIQENNVDLAKNRKKSSHRIYKVRYSFSSTIFHSITSYITDTLTQAYKINSAKRWRDYH